MHIVKKEEKKNSIIPNKFIKACVIILLFTIYDYTMRKLMILKNAQSIIAERKHL
jgi:hypothetical protein